MRMLKSVTLATLLVLSLPLQAEPVAADHRYAFENGDGLVSVMTSPAAEQVWAQARALHARLEAESTSLQQVSEKGKMSAGRLLLAVVMPGGFLYAAVTGQRAVQARQELAVVTDELTELDEDLRYWHELHAGVEMAMLR